MRPEQLSAHLDAQLPLLFAHRGYAKRAPENTLAAFAAARSASIPGVELDVHRARSGELVVVHDFNLKRITGEDLLVEECDIATLKSLDAGAWFGERFRGERLPLLSELFDALADTVYYDIEIKSRLREDDGLAQELVGLIRGRRLARRCLISSFNPYAIRAARRLAPEIPTAIIYSSDREVLPFLRHGEGRFISGCPILKPDFRKVTPMGMFLNQRVLGYPVITWTVDEPETAERLLERGVAGLISNDPAPLLALTEGGSRSRSRAERRDPEKPQ